MLQGYFAEDASRLTGTTPSQLRYWDKIRLVQPSLQRTAGRAGRRRIYSFRDLVTLRVVVTLKESGLSLQRISRAWNYLRRMGVDPAEVRLETDGISIYAVEDNELRDLLKEGQLAFFVELDKLARRVDEDETLFEMDKYKFLRHLERSREYARIQLDEAVGS